MTFEGLGEMFEGDSADMCAWKISASVDGGPSGGSRMRRPGSEDPQDITALAYHLYFGTKSN